MGKFSKIVLVTFLIIILGLLGYGGYFLYRHKNTISNVSNNLPGKLFGPKSSQKAITLNSEQIIYWTNKYRADNNLNPLTQNSLLIQAAQKKVDDMFLKQYFEHVSPDGVKPSDLVLSVGYQYKVTGENLALGDFKDEKDLVDAWMNSPGHRANILNSDYTEIGVATGLSNYQDWGKTWMAVQEFGKPLPKCDKPDENTLNNINTKKAEYESLVSQVNSLNSQTNAKIQQGNEVAQTSGNAAASPYWTEAESLKNQAKTLETQAQNLSKEIETESSQYNSQVNTYNACIKQ